MSGLLEKKQPRTVEPIEGERVKRVEEDYFVVRVEEVVERQAEGYKGREKKEKKLAAAAAVEQEDNETILNFQAVDGLADRTERPQRQFEDRRGPREHRGPRGPRNDHRGPRGPRRNDRAPKVDLKNEKAFPKL